MTYEFMYNIAMDLVNQKIDSGDPMFPDDTVCVIFTKAGKIYTGMSYSETYDPGTLIHAEIDAMKGMHDYKETAIEAIMLVMVCNRGLILPCNSCLEKIINLDKTNAEANIVVNDRLIRIDEVTQFAAPQEMLNVPPPVDYENAVQGNVPMVPPPDATPLNQLSPAGEPKGEMYYAPERPFARPAERASGDLLRQRVNSLMSVADDDDDDVPDEPRKGKGLFGGLFRR